MRDRSLRTTGRGLLLLAMCTGGLACTMLFGPEGAEVSVSAFLAPPRTDAMTIVTRLDGRSARFEVDGITRSRIRQMHDVGYGEVPVSVIVRDAGGDTLASIQFMKSIPRDHTHGMNSMIGSQRPQGMCIGVLLFAPISGSSTDTLFVTHGSMPNGAIC